MHDFGSRPTRTIATLLLIGALGASAAFAIERGPVPADAPPGISVLPEDNGPIEGAVRTSRAPGSPPVADVASGRYDEIGGDDLDVRTAGTLIGVSLASTDTGALYLAHGEQNDAGDMVIRIWRYDHSDGTYDLWATLAGAAGQNLTSPELNIAEGSVDACYVAYRFQDASGNVSIRMSSSPLGSTAAFGAPVVVMAEPGVDYGPPRFDTDAVSWDEFYIYLVASGADATGRDIWFARSTDQGATFESPYRIAELLVAGRQYQQPDISFGYGGHVHVAWTFTSDTEEFDHSIRYRRANTYASGGLAGWEYWDVMTTSSDGERDQRPVIHASALGDEVVLAYSRFDAESYGYTDARVFVSDDAGASFGAEGVLPPHVTWGGDIVENHETGIWALGFEGAASISVSTAHVSDLTSWVGSEDFNDSSAFLHGLERPDIALRSATSGDLAVVWTYRNYFGNDHVRFDAEWFDDPGWPNMEPGFPVGLWAPPISPPAVVDVDGDGDLEIVFSDELRQIQVINHDGTSVPGWPVDVGVDLSDGPVAVGDLNLDGEMILCVGGSDGKAYAYDRHGDLLPGWPSAITPPGHDVYVSIGALGPPYPRSIVCAGANYVTVRNHRGVAPPGTHGWPVTVGTYAAPPAIGDIDGDGVSEVVCGLGRFVFAFEHGAPSVELSINLPAELSDALTLGDLDGDGDLEILCPTVDGVLYALDHTGAHLGGNFPYDSGTAAPLTSVALAQFRGSSEPDLAFANRNWSVHGLYNDGSVMTGYPVPTSSSWYLYGAPVITHVKYNGGQAVIGDRRNRLWTMTNVGAVLFGWPRDLGDQINLSPACGDLDLDGFNEIVVLTDVQLHVFDIGNPPLSDSRTWAMYGHDPRRTGCADCPEDLVTAVDDGPVGLTRVSFAAPSPNPAPGRTSFAFAVPLRSAVSLEIMDLRGRRVATVFREEMDPGDRFVAWGGDDANGRPVPAGQYLARLRVRGPGVREELTRKLTVVR